MKSVTLTALLPFVSAASCISLKNFKNLVTFGDSYTDEGRLGYFIGNGEGPPAGTLLPESAVTASGGLVWPRIIAKKNGVKSFNYAVSGATCSNDLVERQFPLIGQPFPSVTEYEIPAFKADLAHGVLYKDAKPDNTVYALWIGTNDLGYEAYLTNSQKNGGTLDTLAGCMLNVFDEVYASGGRNFVLMNTVPLEQSPLYNVEALGGIGDSQFWGNKTDYDVADYKQKMYQYSQGLNAILDLSVAVNAVIEKRWPGATVSVFDVHSLVSDIIASPAQYLEAPADASGFYLHCDPVTGQCVKSEEDMASFLWYDELHPSERADEIIAAEFVKVVGGTSKYATTYVVKK